MSDALQLAPPAGWYDDPSDAQLIRYWDGEGWTTRLLPRPASVAAVEPVRLLEPAVPVEPIESIDRVAPVEPVAPVEAVMPVEPVETTAPVQPARTPDPVPPVEPVDGPAVFTPSTLTPPDTGPDLMPATTDPTAMAVGLDDPDDSLERIDWTMPATGLPFVPTTSVDGIAAYSADDAAESATRSGGTVAAWLIAGLPAVLVGLWAGLDLVGEAVFGQRFVAPGVLTVPMAAALVGVLVRRDRRALLRRGILRRPSPLWLLLLPPIGYLLARTLVLRGQGVRSVGPLVLTVALGVGAVALAALTVLPQLLLVMATAAN